MILQLGAAVVEHVFIKGTFFVIESTIGWGYWGVSKVYHYYYTPDNNDLLERIRELELKNSELETINEELQGKIQRLGDALKEVM